MTAPAKAPKAPKPPVILDATVPQGVQYAISLPLRDAQIALSIRRVAKRIEPAYEVRSEPIALVCYGPSLTDTWERVRDFPVVMTCSGAHRFLVERGIVPHFHVEVDPRPHKTALIGPPQPGTTYLIASTCHPKVFDHLEGCDVRLWHVFDSKEDGIRTLPHGEWALTGGCSVGLRMLTIAGFLGFRDLHVFGMDGNQRPDVGKHAGAHPNQPKDHALTEYPPGSGTMWETTPAMLEAARGTWHELDQMPEVRATFYGDGLVQVMARDYVPKGTLSGKPFARTVALRKEPLISEEYRVLNRQLHESRPDYGIGGGRHADAVLRLRTTRNLAHATVLDYGCGKSALANALPFPIYEYDPAIPEKAQSPRPADICVCTDVLEHVEPERIQAVMADLKRVTRKLLYATIHTGPAQKLLADGRNAHVLQRPEAWWVKMLGHYFDVQVIGRRGPEITVLAAPRQAKARKTA